MKNGWYSSTNKSHSSSSTFQIRAVYGCTLVLRHKTSSETNYDKLQILVNGVDKITSSGQVSEGTTTNTSVTNTSAEAGKTYYYKVKAIHSKSAANSAYSSVDSIKVK